MKNILLLLLINSLSFGMENDESSCDQTNPCKQYYVDSIHVIIYFGEVDVPFPNLKKTKEQAIEKLKESVVSHHPEIIITKSFVSLLRIYNDPQGLEPLLERKKSTNEIEEKLLKLGAEQGHWTIPEAIEKIKQHAQESRL